jgi:hypothetical protein
VHFASLRLCVRPSGLSTFDFQLSALDVPLRVLRFSVHSVVIPCPTLFRLLSRTLGDFASLRESPDSCVAHHVAPELLYFQTDVQVPLLQTPCFQVLAQERGEGGTLPHQSFYLQ